MATVTFGNAVVQFLQPYFFYSIAFLAIFFVNVKIFLKCNPCLGRNLRSFLLLIPLLTPLIVYLFAFPATTTQVMPDPNTAMPVSSSVQDLLPQIQFSADGSNQTTFLKRAFMLTITVPSIAGILCLMGLTVACAYFGLMMAFGHKIASRALNVVEISGEEFVTLQQQVRRVSQEMAIKTPKIGIIEDLRPNALTLGYGRNSMLVVSIGLLNNFSGEELTAILAHELAHIKQKDFFFKTAFYSLNLLLFFNPLGYFISSQALKERELLADERAAKFLNKPHLMANVLIKIEKMLQTFPREQLTSQLSTSLFLISPLAHRPALLAAHPQVSCRVHNILAPRPKLKLKPKKVLALMLILVFMTTLAGFFAVSVESAFLPKIGAPDWASQDTFNSQAGVSQSEILLPSEHYSNSTFIFLIPADSLPIG
jgi:Zn-dependent protease with chaperone function